MSKQKGRAQQSKAPLIALGVGAVAIIGFFVWAVVSSDKSQPSGTVAEVEKGCTHSMVTKADIPGLETVPCISQQHVAMTQKMQYRTDPPLSGDHYQAWVQPRYYESKQIPELLVHNLEHGNIVIYYDKSKLSSADIDALKKLAAQYPQDFGGVVVVPYTGDAKHPVILTAWENALRLEKYDQSLVDKFVATFRGQGPERG